MVISAYAAVAAGDNAALADLFIERMNKMSKRQRVTLLQILGDYFCLHCGKEQPPGDCQCFKE